MLRRAFYFLGCAALALILYGGYSFIAKYQKSDEMIVSVEEVTSAEYPEDPSHHSIHYAKYGHRYLRLIKKDRHHFDFIFESSDPDVATVTFKDIDVSLFVPIQPKWTKSDPNLEIIALVDREWNRQQTRFRPGTPHLEIGGGDGVETENLYSAELARNCLNAGLWEVLLFTKEEGQKALYYQGWFTFPLGHYKEIFEEGNGVSYWKHWHRLEHWFDPEGTVVKLDKLRHVIQENTVDLTYNPKENIIVSGEQKRKARVLDMKDIRCWDDICKKQRIQFAAFIPPGRYSVDKPWGNEYERIANFVKAVVRKIKCPNGSQPLDEVELIFTNKEGEIHRFIISGIDFASLPQLDPEEYSQGLYMPMGIAIPPFYQNYEELKTNPPYNSPYFSLLLNGKDEWINHHDVAIDGPVMHRDRENPNQIHIYLLSYERQSIIKHYVLNL